MKTMNNYQLYSAAYAGVYAEWKSARQCYSDLVANAADEAEIAAVEARMEKLKNQLNELAALEKENAPKPTNLIALMTGLK